MTKECVYGLQYSYHSSKVMMLQLLPQRSLNRGIGIIADNATPTFLLCCRGRPPAHLPVYASLRTLSYNVGQRWGGTMLQCGSLNTVTCQPSWRLIHVSTFHLKSINDVHITMESSGSSSKTEHNNSSGGGSSKSNSSCSQGITATDEEEEMEQEEMFVIADPVLGLGNNREWGGPRRGGSMPEPTRFGDWERKGRCTDF